MFFELSLDGTNRRRRTGVGETNARTGVAQAASSATYNVNNKVTNWKGATLQYDNNGNLTSDGANTYAWNVRNQLVSISANGSTIATFQYDAFGRRVSKAIWRDDAISVR